MSHECIDCGHWCNCDNDDIYHNDAPPECEHECYPKFTRIRADLARVTAERDDMQRRITAEQNNYNEAVVALMRERDAANMRLSAAKKKAEKYDTVVSALSVADGGQYRNDTIETVIDYARKLVAAYERIKELYVNVGEWKTESKRWEDSAMFYSSKDITAQKRIERINQLPAKWEKDAGREWGDAEDDERAYRIMRCRNDLLKALKDG